MENDIIYFSDFPNLQETGTRKDNGKFDLTLLPTQELKEEFRGYIMYRCKNGTFRALIQDRTAYNHIAKFLNSRINRRIKSLGDRNPEKWISLLKGWMLEQGITIVKEKKSVYGTVSYGEAVTILYFRNVLKFLGPEDLRDEIEKDVWELKNLDIKIRSNPIYNVKTLDFRKIYQPDIREECKKAVYMNLQYEAIGTVVLYIARRFHRISNLGKILDPVADKLTQAAMLICLFTRFPHVLLLIVIMAGKELYMVVSGCLVIRKTGKVHGADWHGKIVTFLLYGTAAVHIIWFHITPMVSDLLIGLCAIMMVISVALYIIQNTRTLKGETV